jgi:hypothetical protein
MPILETISGWFKQPDPITEPVTEGISAKEAAAWLLEHIGNEPMDENGTKFNEAFTQADIELALDDRGWLVGGKRMAGELDPMSRQVQVNKSRYYWMRDPLAKQAIRLWTDYAFGDQALCWKSEDSGIQDKLDKFMKDRRNRRFTSRAGVRRLSQKVLVDGELFFAVFEDGTIRTFDCLQITDIITDPDDEEMVLAYKRVTTPPNGTQGQNKTLYYKPWDLPEGANTPVDPTTKQNVVYVDGCVMYHHAFDALERRGNGLLTSCADWSREHRRFMTARVAIMQALSKFAFKTTVKGGQNVVNSIRAKLESTFSQAGLSGGTEHQPPAAPGSNFLSNEGVTLEAMPRTTGSADASADGNQLKLMVSAGTGIFLHYFGDPSTGNLATATAMELPMQKMFASYQMFWKDCWRDLFSIVLEEGPDDTPSDITLTLPDILEDDLQKLSAFLTALTSVFPEAKVPALLKQCLNSANVEDLDEVMEDIEDNKEALDAKASIDQQTQHKQQLQLVAAKKGQPGVDPSEQGALGASNEVEQLARAVNNLVESLK